MSVPLFDKVKGFFKKTQDAVNKALVAAFGQENAAKLEKFAGDYLKAALGAELKAVAIATVKELENAQNLSNTDKFAQAAARIGGAALAQGVDLKGQALTYAVEFALTEMRRLAAQGN